jgi:phage terminase large subunit-like protein
MTEPAKPKPAKKSPAKKPASSTARAATPSRARKTSLRDVPEEPSSDALRFERFTERFLKHMKGRWAGQPFVLEEWQRRDITRPLLAVDGKGKRLHREALIGLPRKNGKSELASALALYLLLADGEYGAEVYSVAGSRAQARIVFRTASEMLRASPLRSAVKVYRDAIEVPETASVYRVLSSDAKLAHGYNPHGYIVDELHVHPNGDLLEALRTGTAARERPLGVAITTAGAHRSGIAWDTYERGRAGKDPRMFFYWQGAPEKASIDDLDAALAANPASWVTRGFLEDQKRALPPAVYARLHMNLWWEGDTGTWVPREAWEACRGKVELDIDAPTVIAVDAASKRDTTAVALVQTQGDKFVTKVWHFAVDEAVGFFDYGEVESLIRELATTYQVRRIGFDPFQFVRSAQILDSEGLPVETFPQNDTRMVPASQSLYDAIMETRLVHDGDELTTEQVLAAGVVETVRGWRLHKRKSNRPIDSTIALAMAVQLAEWERAQGDGPRIFVI